MSATYNGTMWEKHGLLLALRGMKWSVFTARLARLISFHLVEVRYVINRLDPGMAAAGRSAQLQPGRYHHWFPIGGHWNFSLIVMWPGAGGGGGVHWHPGEGPCLKHRRRKMKKVASTIWLLDVKELSLCDRRGAVYTMLHEETPLIATNYA